MSGFVINFVVGLLDWGKTTCLQKILDKDRIVSKYNKKFRVFEINSEKCFVLQFSNCDVGIEKFIEELNNLLKQMQTENINCAYVALCCDSISNLKKILRKIPNNYLVNLIFLKNHWDKIAKLNIDFILEQLKDFKISNKILESSNDCNEGDNVK